MQERAERLRAAFGELLKRNLASTKKDVAEKMGASAPNVSSAFGGDPKVLTDRFLSRFNAAFDNIFSLEWLLTGKGEMLKPNYTQHIYSGERITQTGNITDGDSPALMAALSEITEMRQLLASALETNHRTNDRLLTLLENVCIKE